MSDFPSAKDRDGVPGHTCGAEDAQRVKFLEIIRSQALPDMQLYASLHQELRRLARVKMRKERPDHTLQPTALVNEAFMKVFKSGKRLGKPLAIGLIAHAMEEILNDYADAHNAAKRPSKER